MIKTLVAFALGFLLRGLLAKLPPNTKIGKYITLNPHRAVLRDDWESILERGIETGTVKVFRGYQPGKPPGGWIQ